MKMAFLKVTKEIFIHKGIRRKKSKRPALAGKGNEVVMEKKITESDEEDSPEQPQLKRMRRTAAELARQLLFDEPEQEPEPESEPAASPAHSSTHFPTSTFSFPLGPSTSPRHIPAPRLASPSSQADIPQPQPKITPIDISSASPSH